MKHPLLPVTGAYVAGLLLAEFQPAPLGVLFAAAFAVLALAAVWERQRPLLLWPLLILAGWVNLNSRTTVVSPVDLRQVIGTNTALVILHGTLAETPSQRVFERDDQESWRSLAVVQVTAIERNGQLTPAYGSVMTTTSGQLPGEYFAGQTVSVFGVIAPPQRPVAEGLFDYRNYLARQGIHHQFKVTALRDWSLAPDARTSPPWGDRFLAWAQRTLAYGLPETQKDEPLRLLWAMTLGWRPALTNEVSEPFMRSGTMHIFAISGLHIALIAGILVSLLRVARVSRGWCGVVVLPLIWFYTAATGWQSSAIRSTIMMTVIIGGWALRRPSNLINSLMAAAFIILVWDPQQLFQASFQLSFFVVLSIALLMPPLEKVRDRLLADDPLLAPGLAPWWRRKLKQVLRWLLTAFATSLAAWLGSLPLTAYYFHLFSPVTLLANLVVVPASSAALACNLGSLICGSWLPWLTMLFNHAAWACMAFMDWASLTATRLPAAYRYVRSPEPVDFIAYYVFLIGVLKGWAFAPRQWRWWLGGFLLVAAAYLGQWQFHRDDTQLTVLPLQGGHAVFLAPARSHPGWLVDCGSSNSVEFVTKPFLRSQGINRIPNVALTHGDTRFVGGFVELESLFPIDRVYTSPYRFRSPVYRRITAANHDRPNGPTLVNPGDFISPWQMLHPARDAKFSQADDAALVLLGTFKGVRVLLLSDLGRVGQETLLGGDADLHADIVVTGIPEQSEALSAALLEKVQPRLIILADSEFPAQKRAKPQLIERLQRSNVPVLSTRSGGAVTMSVHDGNWELRTMDGMRFTAASLKHQ